MVKRLIGGLVLLNLCAISLDVTADEVDITNDGVLEQLKELRTFIDEKRNFSKESKQLKPVLVQYRSSASKIDGVVQCNMEFNTDALHLNICGTSIQNDGTPLTITINVVYEYTDYVGYTIKTAKLNATQNQPIFESIVDKNGNKRFIEGDIAIEEITGITKKYGKWSLSGSHLMCVIACEVDANTEIPVWPSVFSYIELPEWIIDKIYPLTNNYLDGKDVNVTPLESSGYSALTQRFAIKVDKTNNQLVVQFDTAQSVTPTDDSGFRLAIDLLIDSASEE